MQQQQQHDDGRVRLVLVGFSPVRPLAAIARSLGWQGHVLSDPDRELYAALKLGRAPIWRVYTPRTLLIYARAARSGTRPRRVREDARQLGGDAVLLDGRVRVLWQPRTPDDRPAAQDVLEQARGLARGSPR